MTAPIIFGPGYRCSEPARTTALGCVYCAYEAEGPLQTSPPVAVVDTSRGPRELCAGHVEHVARGGGPPR